MGSGLGSMSKLTNRMGGRAWEGLVLCVGVWGCCRGKELETDSIWALPMVKMRHDHNFALQL